MFKCRQLRGSCCCSVTFCTRRQQRRQQLLSEGIPRIPALHLSSTCPYTCPPPVPTPVLHLSSTHLSDRCNRLTQALSGASMEECLRKACPCLEPLWERIFNDKKPPAADRGGGGGGGSSSREQQRPPSPAQLQERGSESGSVYTALWAFESRHPDELSFQEGDLFSVTSRSGDWWTARRIDKNGRVLDSGIVPSNYLARAESLEMQP